MTRTARTNWYSTSTETPASNPARSTTKNGRVVVRRARATAARNEPPTHAAASWCEVKEQTASPSRVSRARTPPARYDRLARRGEASGKQQADPRQGGAASNAQGGA